MIVSRGDIYYVCRGNHEITGSEQKPDRPAVIVSNNKCNVYSEVVEVVYLTGESKNPLPTHVPVMCRIPSTALCEQIVSISKKRLSEYVRSCSDAEMEKIDRALMISIGLNDQPKDYVVESKEMIDDLKMKLEGAERELDETKAERDSYESKLREIEAYFEQQACLQVETDQNQYTVLKTERDLYKQQYEMLLERLVAR